MARNIVSVPGVLGGKPVLEGTRISVELILDLLSSGASRTDVLREYPVLTDEDLSAVFAYVARTMRSDVLWEKDARS